MPRQGLRRAGDRPAHLLDDALERARDEGRGEERTRGEGGRANWFSRNSTNAVLEGLNSVIQSIRRAARGFRNVSRFKSVTFLPPGRLDFSARGQVACATHQ